MTALCSRKITTKVFDVRKKNRSMCMALPTPPLEISGVWVYFFNCFTHVRKEVEEWIYRDQNERLKKIANEARNQINLFLLWCIFFYTFFSHTNAFRTMIIMHLFYFSVSNNGFMYILLLFFFVVNLRHQRLAHKIGFSWKKHLLETSP